MQKQEGLSDMPKEGLSPVVMLATATTLGAILSAVLGFCVVTTLWPTAAKVAVFLSMMAESLFLTIISYAAWCEVFETI